MDKTYRCTFKILSLLVILLGLAGCFEGDKGEKGEKGDQGPPGAEGPAGHDGTSFARVTVPDDMTDIAAAVASLTSGGIVFVRAQDACHEGTSPIHINRSNISLIGEQGVCIRLADGANQPVILIGSSSPTVSEAERIFDIHVSGFKIDGNRANQKPPNENDEAVGLPNVKINAIAVRGAERVWLNQLVLTSARSGGLVISQQSRKVFVHDVIMSDNFFDGLAVDGAHEVFIENFVSESNDFSGVSIDTGSSGLLIQNGVIQKNGDNGIFVRFTQESRFKGLSITDNCNFGVFASHANTNSQEGVVELVFSDLDIFRNSSAAFQFATDSSQGSVDNVIMSSRIAGNAGGDIIGGAGLEEFGNLVFASTRIGPTNRICP